jgi:hypothetical protein
VEAGGGESSHVDALGAPRAGGIAALVGLLRRLLLVPPPKLDREARGICERVAIRAAGEHTGHNGANTVNPGSLVVRDGLVWYQALSLQMLLDAVIEFVVNLVVWLASPQVARFILFVFVNEPD